MLILIAWAQRENPGRRKAREKTDMVISQPLSRWPSYSSHQVPDTLQNNHGFPWSPRNNLPTTNLLAFPSSMGIHHSKEKSEIQNIVPPASPESQEGRFSLLPLFISATPIYLAKVPNKISCSLAFLRSMQLVNIINTPPEHSSAEFYSCPMPTDSAASPWQPIKILLCVHRYHP